MATKLETFSLAEPLRFGWEKTTANLRVLLPIGLVGAALGLVQNALSRAEGGGLLALAVQVLQQVVMLVYLRTSLRLRDGEPTGEWDLGRLLRGFWPFLLTGVLYGLIVAGGLLLVIVPGVLWAVQLAFATFAVADGEQSPIDALRASRRLTAGRTWRLLELGLLCLGVNLLGALALGVGLFVTIPTTLIAAAWVFRWLQAHAPREKTYEKPTVEGGAAVAGLVLAVAFLAACAPGFNEAVQTASGDGVIAGFWRGLWHGIIAPVTFVISLFTDRVGIYEAHNNGGWYNLGFLLGLVSFHGGRAVGGAVSRRYRRRP